MGVKNMEPVFGQCYLPQPRKCILLRLVKDSLGSKSSGSLHGPMLMWGCPQSCTIEEYVKKQERDLQLSSEKAWQ
jgi:hypothetical protein